MNDEKQIAQAILDAQKMHEESYVTNWEKDPGHRSARMRTDFGEYSKDWEECFQVACKVNCLSPNMWSLLVLANHWYNDVQLWAEDVLAGKNILGEAKKEHAKMEDGIKQVIHGAKERTFNCGEGECVSPKSNNCQECTPNEHIPNKHGTMKTEMESIIDAANLYKDYSYYVGGEVTCKRMPLKYSTWIIAGRPA